MSVKACMFIEVPVDFIEFWTDEVLKEEIKQQYEYQVGSKFEGEIKLKKEYFEEKINKNEVFKFYRFTAIFK